MRDLRANSADALLRLHYRVLDELKSRGIIRSANAPIGEYAELLFCEAFGWTRAESNSNFGYDAIDADRKRIQIKARRIVGNGSRQLGSLRNLQHRPFDKLAAVLFAKDLRVARAAIIPIEVVQSLAEHNAYTNSFRFILDDAVWNLRGVQDATNPVSLAARELA
jgi:hypothetical protein